MIPYLWLLMLHCAILTSYPLLFDECSHHLQLTFQELHFLNVQNMRFAVALSLKCALLYQLETDALFHKFEKTFCPISNLIFSFDIEPSWKVGFKKQKFVNCTKLFEGYFVYV